MSDEAIFEMVPGDWRTLLRGYTAQRQSIGRSEAAVFRLGAAGKDDLFLKAEPDDVLSELAGEAARLRWLHAQGLPCPEVLGFDAHAGRNWLLMTGIPGKDLASSPELPPDKAVGIVADALRRLHALPISSCPFDHRLPRRLAAAATNFAAGRTDPTDFDAANLGRSPEAMLAELVAGQPGSVDLVVAHGDACLPNLLADARQFTGYVDCGRLGVADRYQDIALASRSIADNLGAEWVLPFRRAYGIVDADAGKLAYYRLLDEFF